MSFFAFTLAPCQPVMADTQSLSLFLQTPSVSIWQHCLSTILWLYLQQSLLYLQVGLVLPMLQP